MADSDKSLTSPHKKVEWFEKTPIAKAIVTKLVEDPNKGRHSRNYGADGSAPNLGTLGTIANSTTQSINDAENIFATIPDTELAMQVLVSCILSPNDMRAAELTWSSNQEKLDAELTASLLKIVSEYFEDEYKIKKMLPAALEDALFKTGSYPLMVIPESSIDDIINGRVGQVGIESFKRELDANHILKPLNILGPADKFDDAQRRTPARPQSAGLESILNDTPTNATYDSKIHDRLYVTDNFATLKLPKAIERITKHRVMSKIHSNGLESLRDIGRLANNIYTRRSYRAREMVRVNPTDKSSRATIGHPLVMKLPSEAVIPVHTPSNPTDHLGYYILIDELGNPISRAMDSSYYQDLIDAKNETSNKNAISGLLSRTRRLQSSRCSANLPMQELMQSYTEVIEQDLLERLRNGAYGKSVEIARPQEIYRIMLARTLAGMNTQILYVPAELITYIAFDYNRLGIGRSLLDKSKLLANIRAILLFGNTMSALNNSIPRREVRITLDEQDPEPEKTVEMMQTEWAKQQSQALPLATTSPLDIVDGIRRAQTSFSVTGNTLYPETNLEVSDVQSGRAMIDNELDERMKERHIMSMGLTPELVDATVSVDFAASIIQSNLLFTKRLAIYQEETVAFIKDHVVKYTFNSGELMSQLIKEIQANGGQALQELKGTLKEEALKSGIIKDTQVDDASIIELITYFLDSLEIKLPTPDQTKLENQLAAFQSYAASLDAILPAYINEDVLRTMMGPAGSEHVDVIITLVKGYFLRQWLAQNNVMPELQKLITTDNADEQQLNLLEQHSLHIDGLTAAMNELINKIVESRTPEDAADDYSSAPTEPDAGADAGGDDLGDMPDDDLDNMDIDMGEGEEEPAEEPAGDEETEEPAEADTPEEPAEPETPEEPPAQ